MKNFIITFLLLSTSISFGQSIQNAKTIEVSISGNCNMCKATIEKAANQVGVAHLDWNTNTKKAQLTYNTKETTPQKVLKRVADAGYDNEFYKANDKVYGNLHGCCQYPREKVSQNTKKSCCSGAQKASCSEIKKASCETGKKACKTTCDEKPLKKKNKKTSSK